MTTLQLDYHILYITHLISKEKALYGKGVISTRSSPAFCLGRTPWSVGWGHRPGEERRRGETRLEMLVPFVSGKKQPRAGEGTP